MSEFGVQGKELVLVLKLESYQHLDDIESCDTSSQRQRNKQKYGKEVAKYSESREEEGRSNQGVRRKNRRINTIAAKLNFVSRKRELSTL